MRTKAPLAGTFVFQRRLIYEPGLPIPPMPPAGFGIATPPPPHVPHAAEALLFGAPPAEEHYLTE
jgi:hypothetical protein